MPFLKSVYLIIPDGPNVIMLVSLEPVSARVTIPGLCSKTGFTDPLEALRTVIPSRELCPTMMYEPCADHESSVTASRKRFA